MQIRHKLILGLTGICLLVGAVGLNAVIQNRVTQRHVRELSLFPIALNETASGMSSALVSSQKTVQELMSESQRSILEPDERLNAQEAVEEARGLLITHIGEFQRHIATARTLIEADLRASRSPGGDEDEIEQEQGELKSLDEVEAELVVYRNNLNSFTDSIESDLADADEVLRESVEPHYTTVVPGF